MRVAFAGTPEFAATALEALHGAGCSIVLVLTQPDRPAGRGLKLQASPVKRLAQTLGLPVAQPRSLRLDGRWPEDASAAQQALRRAAPDVMVVAAYGLILPAWALQLPLSGCLNIHASLLPRWRGAAPIHRAVQAGDSHSGVTIMLMDEGLDTGPILLAESIALAPRETTASLQKRLADLGADLIVSALRQLGSAGMEPAAQPSRGVTYANKIDKSEAAIDWSEPALVLERRIRAFDPFPGASCRFRGEVLKVWRAEALASEAHAAPPATVVAADSDGVVVTCGQGALRILELQRASARRNAAELVAQAVGLRAGDTME